MEQNISTDDSTPSGSVSHIEEIGDINNYEYALVLFMRVLSVIEIPVMILTLIALCFLVKSRPAATVFVGNLILADLIQVIYILMSSTRSWLDEMYDGYFYCLIASVYFMACVALERYLLVSHPIWYKSHQSLKLSCFISVIVWLVPLPSGVRKGPHYDEFILLYRSIACLIPYPIIILCFVGTWRALSRLISLTALKRKLILGRLFLVLMTYTFLILPFMIMVFLVVLNSDLILTGNTFFFIYGYLSVMLLCLNPLADCVLYLFMRPDVGKMMKSVHCCCKHNQDEHSVVNPRNSCSTVVCCISAQRPESHSLNTRSSV